MGQRYSQDLREHVAQVAAVPSLRKAVRFGSLRRSLDRWMVALCVTGTVAARPQGWAAQACRRAKSRVRARRST